MKPVVIVEGVRTAIGKFGGMYKDVSAQELGKIVLEALVAKTRLDPKTVDEVIMGCVNQGSEAPNVARVSSLLAGFPKEVTNYTVHRNCASGIQAIVNCYQNIQCGDADIQIAAGSENMSRMPYVNRDLRWGRPMKDSKMVDSVMEGLTDPTMGQLMGRTAENLVEEFGITRQAQDQFAMESHQKAAKATQAGRFQDEIVPVTIKKKKGPGKPVEVSLTEDESINASLTVEALAGYSAVFKEGGTVTAGNACPLNDGAAAALVMSEDRAKALGYKPLAYIRAYGFAGVEPERMGIGPSHAMPVALKKAGLTLQDIQLIEINEAFAGQYLAVEKKTGLNREIVNVNGGAIALGHPVGATGVRFVVTLIKEMARRNLQLGMAALCVGGGLGAAIIVERK